MRINPFTIYLVVQAIVIVAVVLIFKIIPDKAIAATVAGVLFVVTPAWQMWDQYGRSRFRNKLWYIGELQFWILFALPILGVRLLNWGVEFSELSVFGVPAPLLHQWSSKSYMVMMIATVWHWFKNRKKAIQ